MTRARRAAAAPAPPSRERTGPVLPRVPVGPRALLALQRTAGNSALGRLLGAEGASRPLDGGVRAAAEAFFGRDLGDVRLHTGPEAGRTAAALDAAAYAVGDDVVLDPARVDLATPAGLHVLVHELGHVLQHRDAPTSTGPGLTRPHEPVEQQADAAARLFSASPGALRSTSP